MKNFASEKLTWVLENQSAHSLAFQSDYLIMTIPPLTYTKLALTRASEEAKGNATLAGKYVQLLSQLTEYYNTDILHPSTILHVVSLLHQGQSMITR
ncbi:hypothetical protein VP01_93g1 [Puccinia sorghi]|uniref:Uncharacterized protein n=1 Tax=Puccinia sorghi TaxID=27349 RepID=A0A0L6U8U6_9BASI|nr:hypothetical protein VP01_93g1 [Puccinia sorghi]